MSLSILLLQLAGAVLLLLYAVHLVRTGIERVYGEALRYTLRRASKGKVV